jgi:hypothetical protein
MQAFRNLSANATNWDSSSAQRSLCSLRRSLSLQRLLVCVTCRAIFLTAGGCQRRGNLRRGLGKADLGKADLLSKASSADPPVVHVQPSNLLRRGVSRLGKSPRQKNHDVADKLGVWHVMCIRIPISCRSGTCGGGMAQDVRSLSLVFFGGWRRNEGLCPIL